MFFSQPKSQTPNYRASPPLFLTIKCPLGTVKSQFTGNCNSKIILWTPLQYPTCALTSHIFIEIQSFFWYSKCKTFKLTWNQWAEHAAIIAERLSINGLSGKESDFPISFSKHSGPFTFWKTECPCETTKKIVWKPDWKLSRTPHRLKQMKL